MVFLAQYLAGLSYLAFQHSQGGMEFPASGGLVGAIIAAAIVNSILLVEGIPMVAERFLKRQREEGKKEGQSSQQKKWEAWNARRLQAESLNRPFMEEPPTLEADKGNAQ